MRPAKPDVKAASAAGEKPAALVKTDAPKSDVKADGKLAAKTDVKPVKADAAKPAAAANAGTQTKTAAVKPEAKPVKAETADAKPDAKSPAKPASKTAIPDLRQTASVY